MWHHRVNAHKWWFENWYSESCIHYPHSDAQCKADTAGMLNNKEWAPGDRSYCYILKHHYYTTTVLIRIPWNLLRPTIMATLRCRLLTSWLGWSEPRCSVCMHWLREYCWGGQRRRVRRSVHTYPNVGAVMVLYCPWTWSWWSSPAAWPGWMWFGLSWLLYTDQAEMIVKYDKSGRGNKPTLMVLRLWMSRIWVMQFQRQIGNKVLCSIPL